MAWRTVTKLPLRSGTVCDGGWCAERFRVTELRFVLMRRNVPRLGSEDPFLVLCRRCVYVERRNVPSQVTQGEEEERVAEMALRIVAGANIGCCRLLLPCGV